MLSLYELAVETVAENLHSHSACRNYEILPVHRQIDVLSKVKDIGHMTVLLTEFRRLQVMKLFLKAGKLKLHSIYQCLMDCGDCDLTDHYTELIESQTVGLLEQHQCIEEVTIQFALSFGDFLAEAGWYKHAEKVYTTVLMCMQRNSDELSIINSLNCCIKLLRVQNGNCCFNEAAAMVECTMDMISELSESASKKYNKAHIYLEMAILLFARSHYAQALKLSMYALRELNKPNVPVGTAIDVFRLCSKGFILKRELKLAGCFIKHAMKLAHTYFGESQPKYCDTLMDYGFYLLNLDHVSSAVIIYERSLEIRRKIFGGHNLHIGLSHEDLAYAYYVQEYNNGDFDRANLIGVPCREHSYKAISILEEILPSNHLLLASSKRVKEEMAIDILENAAESQQLLTEALTLHEDSLALAKIAFGEHNIQTAKHYGNLGRLYQTLQEWEDAEEMHKRAIKTKEEILGEEDYEVALSVGHLASLYNYDMNKPQEAEELYKRSIAITIKLFGKGYSGLQYDYQGLISLYRGMSQLDKVMYYGHELIEWHEIRTRESTVEATADPLQFLSDNSGTACCTGDSFLALIEHCSQLYPLKPEDDPLLGKTMHSWDWLDPRDRADKLPP